VLQSLVLKPVKPKLVSFPADATGSDHRDQPETIYFLEDVLGLLISQSPVAELIVLIVHLN